MRCKIKLSFEWDIFFRVFPENSDILSSLGVLYMKAGRDDVAFSRLGSAIAFDPWNPRATVAIASMLQVGLLKI